MDQQTVQIVAALLAVACVVIILMRRKKKPAKTEDDFEDHFIDVFLVTDVIQPPRKPNGRQLRKKRR